MKYLAIFLFFLGSAKLQAQEAIPASGGNASGSGGSVSYSAGQLVSATNTGSNGSAAQGVQQPYEIFVISGIEESTGIHLVCSVYPNPATGILMLEVDNFDRENLSYQLYDTDGKLLENKSIGDNRTSINMSSLAPATYFLKITDNSKEVQVFKIVKN